MHADLIILEALDAADRDIARAHARAQRGREAVQQRAEDRAAAESRVQDLQQQQRETRQEINRLGDRSRKYESRRSAAVRALETGAGDADAANRQLEQCTEILDALETSQLEALERLDELAESEAQAETELAGQQEREAAASAALGDTLAQVEATLAGAGARREQARSDLPDHLLRRYDELCARRRTAVARLQGGTCTGCRRVAGRAQVQQLHRDLMVSCRGCGRWLLPELDDALTTR